MNLKIAYRKSRAPLWLRLGEILESPRSVEVNLGRLARHTKQGDLVVVPGKVLGSGTINHEITISAYSFSESAAKSIVDAGGTVMKIDKFIEKYPDGSKVRIIA